MSLPPASAEDASKVASPARGLLVRTRYRCFLPSSLPLTVLEPERGTRRPLRHCGAKSAGARISHSSVSGPVSASKEKRGGSESGDVAVKWGGQENRAAPQAGAPSIPTLAEPTRDLRGTLPTTWTPGVEPHPEAAKSRRRAGPRLGAVTICRTRRTSTLRPHTAEGRLISQQWPAGGNQLPAAQKCKLARISGRLLPRQLCSRGFS